MEPTINMSFLQRETAIVSRLTSFWMFVKMKTFETISIVITFDCTIHNIFIGRAVTRHFFSDRKDLTILSYLK